MILNFGLPKKTSVLPALNLMTEKEKPQSRSPVVGFSSRANPTIPPVTQSNTDTPSPPTPPTLPQQSDVNVKFKLDAFLNFVCVPE